MEILPTTVQLELVSVRIRKSVLRIAQSLDVAFRQAQLLELQIQPQAQLKVAPLPQLQQHLQLQQG